MEQQKQYDWSDSVPSFLTDADAEAVGRQLERIEREYEDGVTTENVVEDAKDEDTPLHSVIYRVSDEKAARLYRKRVARSVMQSLEVDVQTPDGHKEPTHAYVSVKDHDGTRKYKKTVDVLEDEALRQQALEKVLQSIVSLREKHNEFERLSEILASAQRQIKEELGENGSAEVPA